MIKSGRAEEIVGEFASKKVLIVGDLMLDRYVAGSVSRISPEAPVPVVCVDDEYCRPGGAANVALNIQSLGGQAMLAGLVGDDSAGEELIGILNEKGIDTSAVGVCKGEATTVKTRVLAERQQVVRVDREGTRNLDEKFADGFSEKTAAVAGAVDGVIVEDYGKGVVTQKLLDEVIRSASAADIAVGLDPKYGHDLDIRGITIATPNYKEACSAAGISERAAADESRVTENVIEAGNSLLEGWDAESLLVTLGPLGMCLLSKGVEPDFIPTKAREVFDVSGAGDTVIATAILSLVSGADHHEAAELANNAAGIVVAKLGTATCSLDELLTGLK